ncbi:MAG: hypothetical protein DRH90_10805 [Deltaproteobacteria bacterium]|nr:MAG: hypothetical protein DRH90_10805 [Deltaproteobacteria bacterium]RLC09867.1 MAG: hypothetical protein DRI24_21135 [Deltaproteobacteria bacterium]
MLKLQQSRMPILLVEQNLRFAQKYTEYIYILSRGQIVHSSAPADLDGRQDIKQKYLGNGLSLIKIYHFGKIKSSV